MRKDLVTQAEDLRLRLDKADPKLIDGLLERQFRDFLLEINAYIDSYARLVESLRRQSESLDRETNEYCVLRNMVVALKGKQENGS